MDPAGDSSLSLREDLISTAVKFLSNPNIQRSPLEQKERFLRSKGLTENEICRAFERGGVLLSVPSVSSSELLLYRHSRSTWLREMLLSLALFGGVAYGMYWMYKKWFESLLFGDRPKKKTVDERLLDLKKSLEDLITEVKQEIVTVRSEVDRLNSVQGNNSATRSQIESLKSDIASVKGILLNRNQFPSLNTRAEPPSIPAWQIQSLLERPEPVPEPEVQLDTAGKEHHKRERVRLRGDRSESGGSNSSEGEVVTKNSDSSLEIIT